MKKQNKDTPNIIDCLQDGITENTSTGERTLICE
jgi:hypothetical protein